MTAPRPSLDPDVIRALLSTEAWGRHAPALTTFVREGNQPAFTALLKWRTIVARRTFTIELKADLGDEGERFEPMKDIVLQAARDLLAMSTLLASDRRPPQVAVYTEDMFKSTEEIQVSLPVDGDVMEPTTQPTKDEDDGLDI